MQIAIQTVEVNVNDIVLVKTHRRGVQEARVTAFTQRTVMTQDHWPERVNAVAVAYSGDLLGRQEVVDPSQIVGLVPSLF